ncbi:MAG: hypothetical protein AAGF77_15050, partial [Bacteroidota bacterium]
AQCSNTNNSSHVRADNHIFSGQSFGQSIVANASCFDGNVFTEFSFSAQGSSPTKFDLKIYEGQSASGTPRYTQTNISFPPPNRGTKLSVELIGGTGDRTFVSGKTYTFILTGRGGNLIAHVSNNATPGQAYLKTGFDREKDLLFEVGVAKCGNIPNRNKVNGDNHIFSGQSFGQSILIDTTSACYAGSRFTSFSFSGQGSSPTKFDLKIYEGETVSGTPKYTQTGITFPPPNRGGTLSVELTGGTGDLSFYIGQVYTFVLTGKGGNVIVHLSNDVTDGQAYLKTGFDSGKDLLFVVGTN